MGTLLNDYSLAMNHHPSLLLREYNTLSNLYSVMPKTIRSSIFNAGQEFLWTCIDVSEEYIAIGTSVGQLFLYDRNKVAIQHQLSSQVGIILFCGVVFLFKYHVVEGYLH